MENQKIFKTGYIEKFDEKEKIIKFKIMGGSNILDVAKTALQILADYPQYAAVSFISNCGTGIDREYVVTPDMTYDEFEENYKKEYLFTCEKIEEAKQLFKTQAYIDDLTKIDDEIKNLYDEIKKLKLRKQMLLTDVKIKSDAFISDEMIAYYTMQDEENKKRVEAAKKYVSKVKF